MASVFGFAELKSKLEGWRAGLVGANPRRAWRSPGMLRRDGERSLSGPDDLSLLLESLVIPRLVAERGPVRVAGLASAPAASRDPMPQEPITPDEIAEFADMAVVGEASGLIDFVDRKLAAGRSVESLYIDLLAPAARLLGENWEDDRRDFVEVTMGLWRIQEVLRDLGQRCPAPLLPGQGQRRALFASIPGDQHSLGTLMIAECFRRAGWDSDVFIEPVMSELNAKAAHDGYDLIGLTVSCDCSSAALAGIVTAIRAVSMNSEVRIMVGGRVINERPEMLAACKADGSAGNAMDALALADRLVPATPNFSRPL